MKELSKSIHRRLREPNFVTRYFRGSGIDIGGLPDPFFQYMELFPLVTEVRTWDLADGDAQFMESEPDDFFDFVLSSHCLEHLRDPYEGIKNWFRILKPDGHLVITIPDEDLYEQSVWPPKFNLDHKHTFTIFKEKSWSPVSINVIDLILSLGTYADPKVMRVEDSTYRYSLPKFDQTLTPLTESSIEIVIRKRNTYEIETGMSRPWVESRAIQSQLNPYLNQLVTDKDALKRLAQESPPFKDMRDPT